ncbi:aldehyde dehydrogenase family protein [Singulisphaera sp. PoT]|uniref:aldehyde dehydrogenase family protein n=1 Tax=Singulisphaera sp. PoT TaxID=3411797 RepID=UPI003BF5BA8D
MSSATGSAAASTRTENPNDVSPVLIGGEWREARSVETFQATDPKTRQTLPGLYPVSGMTDVEDALAAAEAASRVLQALPDAAERIATFLEGYAAAIEENAEALVAAAASETGLPSTPRLANVELPRTTGQLRQAAAAARDGSWRRATIDTKAGLRSCLAPLGPVFVIGPNNFPFAFNGVAGGDFAAAIAAGNPVIAKAHPLHPTTSRLLGEAAHTAAQAAGLPAGVVQMLYHVEPADGLRLVSDPRLKAVAFTGSRGAGLRLKSAADAAGKLFFGEMSSINPVVILPGALAESGDGIADQLATSVMMGCGQFCTKPGLVLLQVGAAGEKFVEVVAAKLAATPAGTLFSAAGEASLKSALETLQGAGAEVVTGGTSEKGGGFGLPNTLLRTTAKRVLGDPQTFQTEAFGNAALIVLADDEPELLSVLETLEGNLTGTVYSATDGSDDSAYQQVVSVLRPKVGRLLNDKMPTGVAVSPAMNHGGPFPATSQPHFTAVGLPASILRFTQLESYDNVREHRLPPCLRDKNPTGRMWRQVDGDWTRGDIQ